MTIASKLLITALALWAAVFPDKALVVLDNASGSLLNHFNVYYVYVVSLFLFFCIVMTMIPAIAKRKLGDANTQPEFSNFSWFSMMFGAGMGIGLMVFSTAEPLWHFGKNPEIISGEIEPYTDEAVRFAFRYAFLHYGFHPWGIYVVTGLALAYFAHRYHLPLTIRSALVPLLGKHLNGFVGHLLDITAIIATLLGIAVTIGYGIKQLIAGMSEITGSEWMIMAPGIDTAPEATRSALLVALLVVMSLSIVSAATGVGRGIKLLSNLNLGLSCLLLLVFSLFGPLVFLLDLYGRACIDYLLVLPAMSVEVFESDTAKGQWQEQGTILYWAWWIAFAPFVGLFLARISKGRTIREFILGAMLAPAAMCFIWITLLGGTAIYLELSGVADKRIIEAPMSAQLFETLSVLLSSHWFNGFAQFVSTLTVVLILTFLITSADSGILVLNTIMTGGGYHAGLKHKVIWGLILSAMIAGLLISGGGSLEAMQKAMIIGALPFSIVMLLMCLALAKDFVCGGFSRSASTE
ncbi:BCCT family transporter [Nitrosomonas sp.]|uniref:BCCT family transporter n=2 Tax=Nitrosomonas sp. TaxID=42353 RepID=UPI00284A3B36|nr:BCCT family transporter [Nitrosomonas sp.]MCP5292824.1 BCCT family transporter [Burkholderiales bacterium]MDR4515107.1 BCCT family transporter [Nitrosomonas sp.]